MLEQLAVHMKKKKRKEGRKEQGKQEGRKKKRKGKKEKNLLAVYQSTALGSSNFQDPSQNLLNQNLHFNKFPVIHLYTEILEALVQWTKNTKKVLYK